MKPIYKVMLEKKVLSFEKLLMQTFKELKLSFTEVVALIKLHDLLEKKISLIKPALFSKMMGLEVPAAENLLNGLIEKGYLSFTLNEEKGITSEQFNLDFLILSAISVLEKEADSMTATLEDALITFIEDSFQRPITPDELESLGRLLASGTSVEAVKKATLESIGSSYPSIKTIQKNLYQAPVKVYTPPKKDVLKAFKDLWEK